MLRIILFILSLNVIMLSVVMLSVVMLSVVMLSVIMLKVCAHCQNALLKRKAKSQSKIGRVNALS